MTDIKNKLDSKNWELKSDKQGKISGSWSSSSHSDKEDHPWEATFIDAWVHDTQPLDEADHMILNGTKFALKFFIIAFGALLLSEWLFTNTLTNIIPLQPKMIFVSSSIPVLFMVGKLVLPLLIAGLAIATAENWKKRLLIIFTYLMGILTLLSYWISLYDMSVEIPFILTAWIFFGLLIKSIADIFSN